MHSMISSTAQEPGSVTGLPAQKSARSIALEIVTLIFLGVVVGTVASFAVLAVSVVFGQLGNSTSTTFLELLASISSRILNVLVVWARAPLDGAMMGLSVGLSVSVAYLLSIWLERSVLSGASRRWAYLILLPVAGAAGALLGSQGVLAGGTLWVATGGALFGLVAAFALRSTPIRQ